jgi:hypothetical protein
MLCNHLSRNGAHIVEICIPNLQFSLPPKPSRIYKQTVHNAGCIFLSASLLRRMEDLWCNYPAMCFRNQIFFQLAWNTLFDEVLESEGYLCDFGGANG